MGFFDLAHGSLHRLYIERDKNVFDTGNGYYATVEKNGEFSSLAVLIFKANKSSEYDKQ